MRNFHTEVKIMFCQCAGIRNPCVPAQNRLACLRPYI